MSKSLLRRSLNRALHFVARLAPGASTFRPMLHRLRGVRVGDRVFIGDEVYLDNEYPEAIEICSGAQISVRVVIIAHTRGPGKVIIGANAYLGPNAMITCPEGRVLRVGEGAVIGAGALVTRDVPPRAVLMNTPSSIVAKAGVSLSEARTFEEFVRGLEPIRRRKSKPSAASGD